MAKRLITLILWFLTACVPATPVSHPTLTIPPPSPTIEPTALPTEPSIEVPSETPAIEQTATRPPAPTKTEWELTQEQVSRLRNLLDSYLANFITASIEGASFSAGCTGQYLVEQALEAGYIATAYARNPFKLTPEHEYLRVVQGEITDVRKVAEAVSGADTVDFRNGGGSSCARRYALGNAQDHLTSYVTS